MTVDDDLELSWHNLNLRVPKLQNENSKTHLSGIWNKEKKERLILKNLSGYAKSGTLTAIMGPSGSGKTTLLASISKRSTEGIDGDILVNGKPADKDFMLRISGFVPQKDLAIESLTVKEHIEFMAILKMDRRVSKINRDSIISNLLQDLGLHFCQNTQLNNLSGGERKRISLAIQMLTNPPLLFCDEPTTGLDSYSASTVVNVLKKLCSRKKTVLCSIHQPSSDVFMLFDQLYLLLPNGLLAFHGGLLDAKTHFEMNGFRFPKSYNPADYLLNILNPSNSIESERLVKMFNESVFKSANDKELEVMKLARDDRKVNLFYEIDSRFLKFYSIKKPFMRTQLKLLIWRAVLVMYRNLQQIMLRLLMYIFTGLLVSAPYIGVKVSQEGIQNLQGFHYSVITETIFCQAYSVMHTFPAEIPILLREMGNGIYKPGPYYLSKVLVILPRAILETLIFCLVCFSIVGGESNFLVFSAPVIACAITSTAYGCFISSMFVNISTASLLSVPVDLLSYAFCGLFIQLKTVPIYLKWIKYLSRFYYGVEAISILQWQAVDNIPCSENKDIPCINTGLGVLEKYGFSTSNLNLDFIAMVIGFLILHFLGYLSLKRRSKQQSVY